MILDTTKLVYWPACIFSEGRRMTNEQECSDLEDMTYI